MTGKKIGEEKLFNLVDKSKWAKGKWNEEPDAVIFTYADEGYKVPCCLVRHKKEGHWQGYVGVDPKHPFYGEDYHTLNKVLHNKVLTYSDGSLEFPNKFSGYYWFGFDMGHYGDLIPKDITKDSFIKRLFGIKTKTEGIYRDIDYVEKIIIVLAKEIIALSKSNFVIRRERDSE